MTTFVQLLRDGATIDVIETHLNDLEGGARREQVHQLKPADQARLYALAEGRHTDLDFYLPPGTPAGTEVIHDGINTLPVIGGTFQKRFAIDPDDPSRICGYNHNHTGIVSQLFWFTGPGYFLVRAKGSDSPDGRTDHGGQVFINYYEQPSRAPVPTWPAPQPPLALTAGLVWGQMCDYMWRVSNHVSIGTAFKKGKAMNQYFTLVRQDT